VASALGSYDLLLLASETNARHFLATSAEPSLEFPIQCQARCPSFLKNVQQRSPAAGALSPSPPPPFTLPVGVLRNAADSRMGSLPPAPRQDFSVDYLILGGMACSLSPPLIPLPPLLPQ
jgi:hypothetical protein